MFSMYIVTPSYSYDVTKSPRKESVVQIDIVIQGRLTNLVIK